MEIGDTFMFVGGVVVAVILMFIFPLMSLSERTDDISQSVLQAATSEFADKISIAGQIKASDYEAYAQTIGATGNTYEIEIEVQHLDENPGKKSVVTSGNLVGENVRYSTFTSEILKDMYNSETQSYPLKKGDNVIITVKNTNKTMAQMLRTTFYRVTGQNTSQVAASSSSMVVNTGKAN